MKKMMDIERQMPRPVDGFIPRSVVVPLRQEFDYACMSCVSLGQAVREGEIIAIPRTSVPYRASIHSPVPGTVRDIVLCEMPDGKQEPGIKIDFSGSFSYLGKRRMPVEWRMKLPGAVLRDIAYKGVVNTFSVTDSCSLAHQIDAANFSGFSSGRGRRLLVARLFDESPSCAVDALLCRTFFDEVMDGVAITAFALGASGIVLLYDGRRPLLQEDIDRHQFCAPVAPVAVDPQDYLAGLKKEIERTVRASLRSEPFSKICGDDVYVDASTMLCVCSAVTNDTPVMRRYITIDGDCVYSNGLVNVSMGMSIRDAVEQCGGFIKKPTIIIINGVMTGNSTPSIDTPITKYVKSVSLISSRDFYDELESECTSCGNCRRICPYGLSPDILYEYAAGTRRVEDFFIQSASLCCLCNMCNSVCPARLPISQTIAASLLRQGKRT